MTEFLLNIHGSLGSGLFLGLSLAVSVAVCFLAIPVTTDLMVNNSAGLVARYVGRKYRTLVINASTNNPEAANMSISFCFGLMGGWANPLGSLFANIYLMYLLAPLVVIIGFTVRSGGVPPRQLPRLLWQERKLVLWHVTAGGITMVLGRLSLEILKNGWTFWQPLEGDRQGIPLTGGPMFLSLGLLLLGVVVFVIFDRRLHRARPELFEEIHEDDHSESWHGLVAGTVGLILCCWFVNGLFLAYTEIYGSTLTALFGASVFTGLHFFVGALITSLPELRVACRNYVRLSSPDLHTALGSASYSNFTNLILAVIGLMVFMVLSFCGVVLPWG